MANKQTYTFKDAGGDVNGTAATLPSTTNPIEFTGNTAWALNGWFDNSFDFTGKAPTVTIEVSNVDDGNSFNALCKVTNVTLPIFIESEFSKWKWFRIVYDPQGATAGDKHFNLMQLRP